MNQGGKVRVFDGPDLSGKNTATSKRLCFLSSVFLAFVFNEVGVVDGVWFGLLSVCVGWVRRVERQRGTSRLVVGSWC